MWTRKELKDKAKVAFKANYWKTVFVALILIAIAGGMSSFASVGNSSALHSYSNDPSYYLESDTPENVNVDISDGKITVDVDDVNGDGGTVHVTLDADEVDDLDDLITEIVDGNGSNIVITPEFFGVGAVFAGLTVFLIFLVALAIGLAITAFIFGPLEVGANRFLLRNLNQRAEVKEVAYAYDTNYLETVKTIFLRDIFVFLWSLLLIIPGIYKAYQYRMIPYLFADDPTMTKDRAFAESKRMMDGQKWNAFVLDLSFLGWNILSALTLGILGVFYVGPYQSQTNAALYEKLRYGLPAPDPAQAYAEAYAQQNGYNPAYGQAPYGQQVGYNAYGQPVYGAPVNPAAGAYAAPTAPTGYAAPAATAAAAAASAPVIQSASQPPVVPFAAEGYKPEAEAEQAVEAVAAEVVEAVEEVADQASEALDEALDKSFEKAVEAVDQADEA